MRLNETELAGLEEFAAERELPVTTVVRSLILTALEPSSNTPAARIARLHHELDLLSRQVG